MAAKKKSPGVWLLLHALPIGNGNFAVQHWYVKGGPDERPSGVDVHGYPPESLYMGHFSSTGSAVRHLTNKGHRNLVPGLAGTVRFTTLPLCDLVIVAFHIRAEFSMDDSAMAEEHGIESHDPQDFYQATGQWPSSSTHYEIELALVPTTLWDVAHDAAEVQKEGWDIRHINCASQVGSDEWYANEAGFLKRRLHDFLDSRQGISGFYKFLSDNIWKPSA